MCVAGGPAVSMKDEEEEEEEEEEVTQEGLERLAESACDRWVSAVPC